MDHDGTDREPTAHSPEQLLVFALDDLREYADAAWRLDEIDVDLDFGILDDVPLRALEEADVHSRYTRRIAAYYFGENPEEAIVSMGFFKFMAVARRMAKEVDLPTMLGEAVNFTNIASNFYETARRRTVTRLQRADTQLDDIAAVIATAEFASLGITAPRQDEVRDTTPVDVLKAVKVFKGLTKESFPGETDFETLRILISFGGAIVLSQTGPYLDNVRRIKLAHSLYDALVGDPNQLPNVIQQTFADGEWYLYLRSRKAPETLVGLLKQYQAVFKDIAASETIATELPNRVANTHSFLSGVVNNGLERNLRAAIDSLNKMSLPDGQTIANHAEIADYLISMLAYVKDDALRTELEQELERIKA